MKIARLKIDNFRFFKNFELNFKKDDGSIYSSIGFFGENGTGKTTIVEILRDFIATLTCFYEAKGSDQAIFNKVMEVINSRYGAMDLEIETDSIFIKYHHKNIYIDDELLSVVLDNHLEVLADCFNFNYSSSIAQSIIEPEAFQDFSITITADPLVRSFPHLFMPNWAVSKLFFDKLDTITLFKESYEEFAAGKKDTIFETFKNYLHSSKVLTGKTLHSVSGDGLIFKLDYTDVLLPLIKLSAGERRIVNELLSLVKRKISNGTLLFDEPEASYHFEWQKNFLHIISKIPNCVNNQVIFSSHSEDLANSCELFVNLIFNPELIKVEAILD